MVTHAIESVRQIRITALSRMLQKRLCGLDRCNRRIHQPDTQIGVFRLFSCEAGDGRSLLARSLLDRLINEFCLIHDDVYREHMPAADEKTAVRMGRYMAAALQRVRGRKYRVQQSVGLYPTAASTDDYARTSHLVDPKKGKIIAFTMEWGRSRASTPFHPPYAEMRKVIAVSAALLECCLRARSKTTP